MNILKLGIDIGNGFTKFNGLKFASKISLKDQPIVGEHSTEVHFIKYQGDNYVIGEGSNFLGTERYFSKEYMLCLLTALALSSKDSFINAKLVIGLPYTRIETVANRLKNRLLNLRNEKITVDGSDYIINILEAKFFVEGAYPILVQNRNNCITIDKGAGTVCVNHFHNLQLKKSMIYENSDLKLIGDISQAINSNYGTSFDAEAIEPIAYKEFALIKRKRTRIADITEKIIDEHIKSLSNNIIKDFNLDGILLENIFLIGGSANDTKTYFQKYLGNIETIQDNQFINQKLYQTVADNL